MYTPESILSLNNRIRWNEALDAEFIIALDDTNRTGTSGKHFQGFHQLVSVDNIYAAVPETEMSAADFNTYLTDIRAQAVLQVLNDVLDRNDLYITSNDYSKTIEDNASLFDTAIGYKVATSILEMFLSSKRSNLAERNAKLSAANLKLELEGYINEGGHLVAKGIRYHYDKAVRLAAKKLFPTPIIVQSLPNAW